MKIEEFNNVWMPLAGEFYKVALYLLESEAEASDAVQEVFVKLWSARSRLENILNPSAYGTMMVRNHCIDIIRRRLVRQMEDSGDTAAEDAPPDSLIDLKARLKAVGEAMKILPEVQREILRMRVWDEMEFEDIAKTLGISQINARVQLARARNKLKKLTDLT